MKAACLVLRQGQQTAPDAASLSGWQDSHILQQQVAGPGDEDGEADNLATVHRHPSLATADSLCVVSSHRGRVPANPGHVMSVRRRGDPAERVYVGIAGRADSDHLPTVGRVLRIRFCRCGRVALDSIWA
jgi:hypothetical protein